MIGFVKGMEDVFVAVIFSEAAEHGIAREFLAGPAASKHVKSAADICSRPHIPLVPEGDP